MRAVEAVASRAVRHDSHAASKRWLQWINEGPGQGLGRQHRMSRCASGFVIAKVTKVADSSEPGDTDDVEGVTDECLDLVQCVACPLDKQQSVEEEANSWALIWKEGHDEFSIPWPAELGPELPSLAVDAFRAACRTFPNGVGLGWDKAHPKAIARCSDFAIRCLLQVLVMAEQCGRWPSDIGVILVVLLPKADGGRRPIGLFPTLIRVWMRARL